MKIKIEDIKPAKNWSRSFGVGDIKELADSMQEHGQITPIIVDRDYTLVAGFRRYEAAKQLGWEELEASYCMGDPRVINLIENFQRENVSLWEEIQAIRDVWGDEPNISEVARALSKSRPWVRPRVRVWELSPEFVNLVKIGKVGVQDIKRKLARQQHGLDPTSADGKEFGIPPQHDIKRAVTGLMEQGRTVEARALSFAIGVISMDELLDSTEERGRV